MRLISIDREIQVPVTGLRAQPIPAALLADLDDMQMPLGESLHQQIAIVRPPAQPVHMHIEVLIAGLRPSPLDQPQNLLDEHRSLVVRLTQAPIQRRLRQHGGPQPAKLHAALRQYPRQPTRRAGIRRPRRINRQPARQVPIPRQLVSGGVIKPQGPQQLTQRAVRQARLLSERQNGALQRMQPALAIV